MQQAFDCHRLTDEFTERVLLERRARHVTPLVKQPGILAVTDRGLYFQPGCTMLVVAATVKFHPAQACTLPFSTAIASSGAENRMLCVCHKVKTLRVTA